MKLTSPSLIAITFVFLSAEAQDTAAWTDDYSAAAKSAKESDKSLLLLFTGDWIPMCQAFDHRILNTPAFLEKASQRFELVRLNFPESNRLPVEAAKQNQLLKDAYRVRGYPSIILTDAEGKPFGINGFQPVSPDEYAARILEMDQYGKEKEDARATAGNLKGLERAKWLIDGIPDLPGNLAARYFGDEMKQIIIADPEDTLGKTPEYTMLLNDV
ncbi:MAG: thioredoxin family protein, partial [Verrucomicrobiota bacterium]